VAQKGEGFNPIGEIETTTLTNILQEHGCNSRFEFLNIDIEGNDLKALRGLNFSQFRPQLICVECWESELGIDELIKNEIYKYLSSNGYSLTGLSAPSAFFALSRLWNDISCLSYQLSKRIKNKLKKRPSNITNLQFMARPIYSAIFSDWRRADWEAGTIRPCWKKTQRKTSKSNREITSLIRPMPKMRRIDITCNLLSQLGTLWWMHK